MGVYVNIELERKLEKLKHWIKERAENAKVLIGRFPRGFNAKTVKNGQNKGTEWKGKDRRRAKVKK